MDNYPDLKVTRDFTIAAGDFDARLQNAIPP
jgi:hypothetical protein